MTYDNNQGRPQKRVTGALFERDNPNGPALSGFIEIEGVKTYIAIWPRTSKAGQGYYGIDEDKRKAEREAQKAQGAPQRFSPGGSFRGSRQFQPRTNPNITTGPQGNRGNDPPFFDDDLPNFDK